MLSQENTLTQIIPTTNYFRVTKTESKNSENLTDSSNGNNQASCPLIFLAKESAIN